MKGWVVLLLLAAVVRAGDKKEKDLNAFLKRVTPKAINEAIDRGVAWLKTRQLDDGSWGPCVAGGTYGGGRASSRCYVTGPTSFSLFTLLKCKVKSRDKVIKKGLKWLRKKCRKSYDQTADKANYRYSSYESASVVLMLTALYDKGQKKPLKATKKPHKAAPKSGFKKDDWEWMHERITQLVVGTQRVRRVQLGNGGFRYWEGSRDEDMSATQFCLLALREASRTGYPVSQVAPNTWENSLLACKRHQWPNGAIAYQTTKYPWTAGMTAAGTASMIICKEQLSLEGRPVPVWVDPSIENGLKFLGTVFDVETNRFDEKGGEKAHRRNYYHYYHLYTLERLGALANKRVFGGKSWYTRGAAFLLKEQAKSGAWTDNSCMDPEDVLGTCFALLFLKRATAPTVTISGD